MLRTPYKCCFILSHLSWLCTTSKMTYIATGGALNSTHPLPSWLLRFPHSAEWLMQWQQWAANVSHKEVVVEGRMALHSASLLTSHTVNMTSRTPAIHSSQPLSTQADATVSMKCSPLALQQLVYSERLDLLTASHWLNFETVLNNESAHCII